MADIDRKLRQLAERGTRVGSEEMIERVEAEMARDPVVVVGRRREDVLMTKTEDRVETKERRGPGGLAWGLAAFIAVLLVGGLFLFVDLNDEPLADNPPPATEAPETPVEETAMTGVEVVEAGMAAWFSGDAETVAELFEVPLVAEWTEEQVQGELAYQAQADDRLETLECEQLAISVSCQFLHTTWFDRPLGISDTGTAPLVFRVEDGRITYAYLEWGYPDCGVCIDSMAIFISLTSGPDLAADYAACSAPRTAECAALETAHLDAWVAWQPTFGPEEAVRAEMAAYFGGDCVTATLILRGYAASVPEPPSVTEDLAACAQRDHAINAESILDAQVTVENCSESAGADGVSQITCDLRYSNVLDQTVGNTPVQVTTRSFEFDFGVLNSLDRNYPSSEMYPSFVEYADEQGLGGELEAVCPVLEPSVECAEFILDHVDDWAVWHESVS